VNRVIITGGNGFIGRHLVKKMLSNGFSSIALIANTSNDLNNEFIDKKVKEDAPLTFYRADIRNKKSISDIFHNEKADTCIHLAAKISVSDSIKNSDETMNINVNGTMNVLEACSNSKIKNFIFASSAAVYGDVSELPISEKASLRPLSPYGKSKMLAEELVFRYGKLKKIQNTGVLRIFNVYGRGNVSESDVISKFAARLSKGLPPIIYGDGSHIRDFISVDDVIEGILLCVRAMESKNNGNFNYPPVFNLGSGNGTSVSELAQKMIAISGLEHEPIYKKAIQETGVILHSYADMTKAKRDLHFVARKDLETGLREIIKEKNDSQFNT
jgi:UDP-glucose 4-epimerase